MEVIYTGIKFFRDKKFVVDRQNAPFYIVQLFWTPMYMKFNGNSITTPPYTLMILDKDTAHYFRGAEGSMVNDYVCFMADAEDLEGLILNKPIPLSRYEWYHDIIQCIHAVHNSVNTQRVQTSVFLLQALLSKCRELFSYYSTGSNANSTQDSFVQLRNDILDFPHWDWTIPEMAKRCNLGISHFQFTYKEMFSISPIADVVNARVLKAKNLLKGNNTINEIATACGYKSSVHFTNQFKKITGVSPTVYRKSFVVEK